MALLNSLPVNDSGPLPCPMFAGDQFTADFDAPPGHTQVAKLTVNQDECFGVDLTTANGSATSLSDPGGTLLSGLEALIGRAGTTPITSQPGGPISSPPASSSPGSSGSARAQASARTQRAMRALA